MIYPLLLCLLSASLLTSNMHALASENSSNTYTHNEQLAELKKAMQEDPQFEEDFMRRVNIGGKAALYNAARFGTVGAAVGSIAGAAGIAIGTVARYGINKFRTHNPIIPAKNAILARMIAQSIGVSAISNAALWAGVGICWGATIGCSKCGRYDNIFLGECDKTIQHDQAKTQKAHREARAWAWNHMWLTLLTLISDKPARDALHAELDLEDMR